MAWYDRAVEVAGETWDTAAEGVGEASQRGILSALDVDGPEDETPSLGYSTPVERNSYNDDPAEMPRSGGMMQQLTRSPAMLAVAGIAGLALVFALWRD